MPAHFRALAFESLTITDTAGGLAAASTPVVGMKSFVGVLETAQVRYNVEGTTPTSSEGLLLEVGQTLILDETAIRNALFIRTTSTSGVLKGHFYTIPASGLLGLLQNGGGALDVTGKLGVYIGDKDGTNAAGVAASTADGGLRGLYFRRSTDRG